MPASGIRLMMAEADLAPWLELVSAHRHWIIWGGLALLGLLLVRASWRFVARQVRRGRAPGIHPKLAKYNLDHAALDRKRRELARRIIATSTSARLAGFRIVRQVEAVFVEGYRTPEDAVIALKADAAERGANGVLNVKTDRTAAGRCTASGDAVVIAPVQVGPRSGPPGQPAGSGQTPSAGGGALTLPEKLSLDEHA